MTTALRTRATLLTATTVAVLALAACGSDDTGGSTAAGGTTTDSSTSPSMDGNSAMATSDEPFGAGCSAVPSDGEGSFAGMTDDPVATAASNNPALSTLVSAVQAAGLVDSLNSAADITVLAPANAAFEAVPADALQGLLADQVQLSAVLTHHVIEGRLAPDALAGTHTTLNGDEVTIDGSGEQFSVASAGTILGQADAGVICGNVQTANATVYIVDQVLAPAAG